MSQQSARSLETALEPALAAAGFALDAVQVSRAGQRNVVRVVVDSHGTAPLDLDAVADASRVVSAALDEADLVAGAYTLEVTSPGVDRPLTLPRHWLRAVGRLVEVQRAGAPPLTGRVREVADSTATLEVNAKGRVSQVSVALADVTRAVVQVEFSRPGEPGLDDELGDESADGLEDDLDDSLDDGVDEGLGDGTGEDDR